MGRLPKWKISAREKAKAINMAAKHRRRLQREQEETRELVGEGEEDIIKVEPEEGADIKVEDGCYSLLRLEGTEDKDGISESLSSSCFVCVQPLTSSEGARPKVTETEYICFLTDMLGLSRSQSNNYLKLIPEPEKWIGLCQECLDLVQEVGERKELINKIRREIKHNQQQILRKMKSTKLNLRRIMGKGEEGNNGSNEESALKAVRNILTFVHRRQYYTLFADERVPNSNEDKIEHASFSKKISTVGHHQVTNKELRQPRVPNKKSAGPLKTAKLAKALSVNLPRKNDNDKSEEEWRDDHEEEDPIFLSDDKNHGMEDEAFAIADPLAVDDEPDCIVNKPCSVSQSQVFYCGLCSDDQVYTSEEQLQLHTNQLHRPSSSPLKNVGRKRKKRQRKQNFTAGSEVGLEEQPVKKRKANNRSMETASSIFFTTSNRRHTKLEEGQKQVERIESVDDNHISEESIESDAENEEETGENQEKEESAEQAKLARFQYDCPHCPDVKDYGLTRFAQHLAIHQRRPYRCSICSALFPSDEVQMEEHWKKKHSNVDVTTPQEKFTKMTLDPGQIWRCQGCPSRFSKEENRDVHELDCSSLQKGKTATQSVSKMVLSPDLIYSCQVCDKPFQSFDEWRLHRVLHHPDVDRLSCLLCELSFAEKTIEGVEVRDDLKMLSHIKQYHYVKGHTPVMHQHRVLYECEECGLVFNALKETYAHFLNVHGVSKGEGVLPCPVVSCGKLIVNFINMRLHLHRRHFMADPAVCDVCGAGFKYLDTMVEHKLRKHGLLEDGYSPVYSCPVEGCGYRTVKHPSLLIHSQMAHGETRKFICKTCGKGFTNADKLKRHEHIHENKESRPYQCEICGNSFAVRNYLYIHMRLSHENRKFPSTNRKRDPKKASKRKSENKKLAPSLGNSVEAEEQLTNATHSEGNQEDQLQLQQGSEQYPKVIPLPPFS